ncbi:MAG TPA: biotin--[acetyl-CoA-carboxylase] ligase, partial [Oscillospiraceae bacterium]|nr:biotin--[acetyl-CoA-carboxylase] ligase [Oscillospiraceae bacterium]
RVSSTNTVLKERAASGEAAGAVLAVGEQTAGRGRMGRSFFSPGGTGLYLSVLLRPDAPPGEAALITTAAAVAVAEAVEAVSGRKAGIKWVNDVYLDGKKICGILTEAGVDLETGALDYAVLGIGVNVYPPGEGFPEDLAERAGAVFDAPRGDLRNRLAAEILNRVTPFCRDLSARRFVPAYRRRSLVLGREIRIISGGEGGLALALDVDDDCRLRVRYPDGREALLSAGEVSVRLN